MASVPFTNQQQFHFLEVMISLYLQSSEKLTLHKTFVQFFQDVKYKPCLYFIYLLTTNIHSTCSHAVLCAYIDTHMHNACLVLKLNHLQIRCINQIVLNILNKL